MLKGRLDTSRRNTMLYVTGRKSWRVTRPTDSVVMDSLTRYLQTFNRAQSVDLCVYRERVRVLNDL